jgi:uncharacterized protein (TIGR02001 family)
MTQTDGPAIQGGFDFSADNGFYAGIWGSNVNFSTGNGAELDYYAGYAFETEAGVGVDVGFIKFDYPDSTGAFEELYLGLSYGDLGLLYAAGQDTATDYLEVSYAIGAVSLAYGQYDDMGDNLSISYGFTCGSYDCALAYSDFTDEGYSGVDEDAIVFSVSASL